MPKARKQKFRASQNLIQEKIKNTTNLSSARLKNIFQKAPTPDGRARTTSPRQREYAFWRKLIFQKTPKAHGLLKNIFQKVPKAHGLLKNIFQKVPKAVDLLKNIFRKTPKAVHWLKNIKRKVPKALHWLKNIIRN
jgi:hypothetical protein